MGPLGNRQRPALGVLPGPGGRILKAGRRMKRALLVLAGCWLLACGDESTQTADNTPDASSGGQGGQSVLDGSFGGFGASDAPSGGSSGAAGAGGVPSDAGADAAPEAAFVCDTSGTLDCSSSSPASYDCGDPPPTLGSKVKKAIQDSLAANPGWFDTAAGPAACCPKALQPQLFRDDVVSRINASGACAAVDPNNPNIELVVKRNGSCSEQWVILTSANIVRNPPKHQGSCVPAWL